MKTRERETKPASDEPMLRKLSADAELKCATKISQEDIDFAANFKDLVSHPGLGILVLPSVIALVVCVFFFWAAHANLEEVTRGNGRVIPSKPIQVIQSLEGGIISEIYVGVGEQVKKGDHLLRIRDEIFSSQYRENLTKRNILAARIVRLEAEAHAKDLLEFPTDLNDDFTKTESDLFEKRKADYETTLAGLESRYELAKKERDYVKKSGGAVSEVDKINAARECAVLEAEINTLKTKTQREAMEQLDQNQSELEVLDLAILRDKDRLDRTLITSPVDGTIHTFNIDSAGRVIGSGEEIMEIVPADESLLVEVDIRPSDIAFVRPGAEATVKFTAYDFSIYGGLQGTVEYISADTVDDEEGNPFYHIRVRTRSNSLGKNKEGKDLAMLPGMVTEVDILTGKKTVLDYLLKPINRARQRAFRER